MRIDIAEPVETPDEAADLLEEIARLIREGYTSGFHPAWSLDEENP
jgi:hypothetical protein